MSTNKQKIGVDVGGTFTDFSCQLSDGRRLGFKIPSTPGDPSQAVIEGVTELIENYNVDPSQIELFAHGTTVATNAVLERKGATVGLITTSGFRDVLEIGRQMRQQMYSVRLEPETPIFLAPGRRRFGVIERVGPDGEIITPLDESSVLEALTSLQIQKVSSVAVVLLFSFMNPVHEKRIREIILDNNPDILVSLSSEVDPVFREYERTVVTTFDAYIKPTVDQYLSNLSNALEDKKVGASLQIMQSRGGLAGAETARIRPVRLFLSGPAGGVMGALSEGKINNFKDLITVDIGGTSCDIALISDAKPLIRQEGVIDKYLVRVPMVDVNAIGSGGGSIAWLDKAGGLKVGPQSAGSEPGPACYGRGGVEPTVTDASLVLGLIDPEYFAGGRFNLDADKAYNIILEKIAKPLSLSVEEAALGIHKVLNAQMAEGIRFVSIKQGFDPRDFVLMGLGGGGPLHACELASELHIQKVLVPRQPGVLSAAGLLSAPIEHEVSNSFGKALKEVSLPEIIAGLEALSAEAHSLMKKEGVSLKDIEISFSLDICYIGQGYHLEIIIDLESESPLEKVYRDFLKLHDRVYGHSVEGDVRIVNLRAIHRTPVFEEKGQAQLSSDRSVKESRQILCDADSGFIETNVYDRSNLTRGQEIVGPAVVDQIDTTTWIPEGWAACVLEDSMLLLERTGKE